MTEVPRRKSIAWFSWQPTPYNDVLFRELSADNGLKLNVRFRKRIVGSHPWKVPLGNGYAHDYYRLVIDVDWRTVIMPFSRDIDCFVVAGWDHTTTIILLTTLRLLGRRFVLWTDTPAPETSARKGFRGRLRRAWLEWLLRGATAAFSTGEAGVARLRAMGSPAGRTMNLPFVLDLAEYPSRAQLQRKFGARGKVRFVSSGRLSIAIKGHDLAIRALASSLGKGSGWEYAIAGSGPDRERLEELATALGIRNNVRFLGWVEPSDLIRQLCESHVLIHPSPIHDPYPNAVLEGMAAGCVVMASDACGSAVDRIDSGTNGLIHRAGDWEHLAEQILRLEFSGPSLANMASSARKTSESWTIERSLRCLREVLAGRDPCAG